MINYIKNMNRWVIAIIIAAVIGTCFGGLAWYRYESHAKSVERLNESPIRRPIVLEDIEYLKEYYTRSNTDSFTKVKLIEICDTLTKEFKKRDIKASNMYEEFSKLFTLLEEPNMEYDATTTEKYKFILESAGMMDRITPEQYSELERQMLLTQLYLIFSSAY